MHVTSHDVAARAGVSQPTVSRALRDDPRVSEQTRAKVREAADALGYVPLSVGRSLSTRATGQVAMVADPMPTEEIRALREYSAEEMRARVTTPQDRVWSDHAFLCSTLPGGRAELALVIGYGITEDRDQEPRVFNPHGFSLAWLRAHPGEGLLSHRLDATQVLIVKSGTWEVTLKPGVCCRWGSGSGPRWAWRR